MRSLTTSTTSRRSCCLSDDRYAARRGRVAVSVSGVRANTPPQPRRARPGAWKAQRLATQGVAVAIADRWPVTFMVIDACVGAQQH